MTERFGADVARPFFEAFGGRELYLPMKPSHDHVISQAVGRSVLAWLIERFGSGKVEVPSALSSQASAQKLRIRQLIMDGTYSEADISRLVGCETRSVRRQRKAMRDAGIRVPETDFETRRRINTARRERVLALMAEGHSRETIVRKLDTTGQKLRADVAYLRSIGRLPPKNHSVSAGKPKG